MPLFEYKCEECNHITTYLEKAGSKAKHECEECGSTKVKKIFSTFAAQSGSSPSDCDPSPQCGGCQSGGCKFSQ